MAPRELDFIFLSLLWYLKSARGRAWGGAWGGRKGSERARERAAGTQNGTQKMRRVLGAVVGQLSRRASVTAPRLRPAQASPALCARQFASTPPRGGRVLASSHGELFAGPVDSWLRTQVHGGRHWGQRGMRVCAAQRQCAVRDTASRDLCR